MIDALKLVIVPTGAQSRGTFEDFLAKLLVVESGINASDFDWYVQNYRIPVTQYWRVLEPGIPDRDPTSGILQLDTITVEEYFKRLGVAGLFNPVLPSCITSMQYGATNALGFIGYQIGEAALIDSGYYIPARTHLPGAPGGKGIDSYYIGGASDRLWRNRTRTAVAHIAGKDEAILATDANYWRGSCTGKHGLKSLGDLKQRFYQELIIRDLMRINVRRILEFMTSVADHSYFPDFLRSDYGPTPVTLSGFLGAAHLCGMNSLFELCATGAYTQDEFGTSIRTYLADFTGYSISEVIPD